MTRKEILLAVSIVLTAVTAFGLAITYPRPDLSWSYVDILALRDESTLPFRYGAAIFLAIVTAIETAVLGVVGLRTRPSVVFFALGIILTLVVGVATIRMG